MRKRELRQTLRMSYPPPASPAPLPAPGQPQASAPPRRPWNVTLVAILALLVGLIDIVAGVALLLMRNDRSTQDAIGLTSTNIAVYGGVILIVGAIVLLLSFGLFGGSRMSRGVIAFFAVLRIALSVIGIVLTARTPLWGGYAFEIFLSIIVLMMLFAGARTKLFFARG